MWHFEVGFYEVEKRVLRDRKWNRKKNEDGAGLKDGGQKL
jgi:hypothetical protein